MTEFPSQLGQDRWVLDKKPDGGGFFLELGCYHPKDLSNTFALEQRGWRGVSIDPFPSGDWSIRPNTRLVPAAVTSHGRPIRFVKGNELGGDEEHLGVHSDKVSKCERVVIPSISTRDLIDEYEIPKKIDYLSIDVEGSEYDILRSFPFDLVSVDLITVEHNFEVNKRQKIRAFLESRGFEKVTDIDTKWDDWFQSVQKKK